ncbi:MAG: serine hydrolase [Gemella sp.]|nr:serine hydrolase [Gemella sp.]
MKFLAKSLLALIVLGVGAYFGKIQYDNYKDKLTVSKFIEVAAKSNKEQVSETTSQATTTEITTKSKEAKEKVMKEETAVMSSYGLYYDYANLSLQDVVKEFMKEHGIQEGQIAISYKDLTTGELISYNETQPMRAGSTYKLPLSMLIKDKVDAGELSMDERYDITKSSFELASEHAAYVGQFGGAMKISDMWEYALVYSENTPAHKMIELMGGWENAYAQYSKFGTSSSTEVPTFSLDMNNQMKSNKTTTDYYIKVLEHLYNNTDKYSEITKYLEAAFPDMYYRKYLPNLRILHKPGFSREAMNASVVVYEKKPYVAAVYTRYLGGMDENTILQSGEAEYQFAKLAYVINQWHRVNKN